MKKLLVSCLLQPLAVLVFRRFGPNLGAAAERAFENAPDDFPPKWMLLNITAIREQGETIRKQNDRIIKLLEEQNVPS